MQRNVIVAVGLLSALALGAAARADVVVDWNNVMLDVCRTRAENPPRATRSFAMMHVAMFDAVNGIVRRYDPYFVDALGSPDASPLAAAASAAYRVLVTLYPDEKATFDAALAQSLASVPPGVPKFLGRQWGDTVGRAIVHLRRNDNSDLVVDYELSGEFGRWQPTPPLFVFPPLFANWPLVTPWAMLRPDQLRVAAPPAFTSPQFAAAYNEVKDLGEDDSVLRTPEQTVIAYFWEDGPASVTPPGHWQVIAQGVVEQLGYSSIERARLFALLSIAQADAAISSWENKYFYDHVRPVSNIQLEADFDGNDETEADPFWLSEIPTPAFPSYTSGHSTFSSASAAVLESITGDAQFAFCGESPDPDRWPDILPGVELCWSSFRQAAAEAGQSRIYGGIHWQYDNRAALAAGFRLGRGVARFYLRPLD